MTTADPIDAATAHDHGQRLVREDTPLTEKYRSLRILRIAEHPEAARWISLSLQRERSDLLKHELAYVLGQKLNPAYTPLLIRVLEDEKEHVIVRHEAAEALGAIGTVDALAAVARLTESPIKELAETCELSLELIKWMRTASKEELQAAQNVFGSVDPAPPADAGITLADMQKTLVDTSQPLFERYRAMFGLRNSVATAPTPEAAAAAVAALVTGLTCPDSALLRHEVAFVLGQLRHPAAESALIGTLVNRAEHPIVRHEAAEGISAIGTQEGRAVLQRYLDDPEPLVSESCVVALGVPNYVCLCGSISQVIQKNHLAEYIP